jgi:hypothetical protein
MTQCARRWKLKQRNPCVSIDEQQWLVNLTCTMHIKDSKRKGVKILRRCDPIMIDVVGREVVCAERAVVGSPRLASGSADASQLPSFASHRISAISNVTRPHPAHNYNPSWPRALNVHRIRRCPDQPASRHRQRPYRAMPPLSSRTPLCFHAHSVFPSFFLQGSGTIKAGFAGQDHPKCFFPS